MQIRGSEQVATVGRVIARVSIWSGIAGWVVSTTGIVLATWQAPWFSWTGNALSDLGHPARASAPAFNLGLMVAGLLGVMFVIRVATESETMAHWIGVAVMFGSVVNLGLIGLFDITHPLHGTVSVAFFVSLTVGLLVYGTAEVLADRPKLGLFDIWLGVGHATVWAVWAAGLGSPGIAIPEFLGGIAILAWVIPLTHRLYRDSLATRQVR